MGLHTLLCAILPQPVLGAGGHTRVGTSRCCQFVSQRLLPVLCLDGQDLFPRLSPLPASEPHICTQTDHGSLQRLALQRCHPFWRRRSWEQTLALTERRLAVCFQLVTVLPE